jgi:hypothetical protein
MAASDNIAKSGGACPKKATNALLQTNRGGVFTAKQRKT